MKLIPLSKGKFAKVDDQDYKWLSQWKWYVQLGYAVRRPHISVKPRKDLFIAMHREILQPPEGMETDHINRDRLDNQRHNLRACTIAQNQWNAPKNKRNTTGFKGVDYNKANKKYRATISVSGVSIYLGYFPTAEDAAFAYDKAATMFHGSFACLNFT